MPPATTAPAPAELRPLLAVLGRNAGRWRRLAALELAAGLAAVLLAYALVFVLLDSRVHLPRWVRVAVDVGLLAGLGVLAVRVVRRMRAFRLTDDQVALAIEGATGGGLQNRLINALQLSRDPGQAPAELVRAVVDENCTVLGKTPLASAARSRAAILRVAVAVAILAAGGALWAWQPDRISNAASRLLMPFADIAPVYATTLEVEPGDTETVGDVTIRVRIHGERPSKITVYTDRQGTRDSETVPVPAGSNEVAHTIRGVTRSLTYTVRGGDFTSPQYRIEVPTPAALALLRASFEFPPYTGRPARNVEQAGGELEAVSGTTAQLTFVLDQPADEVAMLLERANAAPQRIVLEKVGPAEFRGSVAFDTITGYRLETRRPGRDPHAGPRYTLRVLPDQEPKLDIVRLDRTSDVQPDAVLSLKVTATDDFGLKQVGLFARRVDPMNRGRADDWQPVAVWPANGAAFQADHALSVASLKASEGERVEVALRAIDTDPAKEGRWATGPVHTLNVGGEGAALQAEYEQILRTERELRALAVDQKALADEAGKWVRKLDGDGDIRWDDAKNIDALHAATKDFATKQKALRSTAGRVAREMPVSAGDVRLGLGMLADTEVVRAAAGLDAVSARDTPATKRSALADARAAQDRTARSLDEMIEAYTAFRANWELAHMIPFVKMLADRQKKLAELPGSDSLRRRQEKVIELVALIRPAFTGLAGRLEASEPVLAKAFENGGAVLGSKPLTDALRGAADDLAASRWAEAKPKQAEAARVLAELHTKLNEARAEAARQLIATLKEKVKTDTDAQKAIEDLKPGSSDPAVREDPNSVKIEDIVRMRDVVGAKKGEPNDGKKGVFAEGEEAPDPAKLELLKDSGVRQDPNTLTLAKEPGVAPKLPDNVVDRERNKVRPFVQEKFEDLVGKLLEEADEVEKNFQSITLSTNMNNNDPGDIGKIGGRLNSTGAVAATGNQKPPTINVGGVSRSGRSGARAYGNILGDDAIARRGRDKVQEGELRVPDQAGSVKETKSDDPYTDTSTGVGGKKVESDQTDFSVKDSGKFTPDMLGRMDKPQKKFNIVERQGDKLDPQLAALLRDSNSKQEQIIERIKAIRKDLKAVYLPTDHLDEIERQLVNNLERLKETPDPELFRLQLEALDRLRGAVKVFRGAGSSIQPSLPRERAVRGRVVDDPARATVPGYEGPVKRYYERLADE